MLACRQPSRIACPLLTMTDAEGAAHLSTAVRVEMARRRNLTHINLYDWLEMDNRLFAGICRVSPNLKSVSQGRNKYDIPIMQLSDDDIITLVEHCPLLEDVEITQGASVTAKGIRALARPGNNLQCLLLRPEIAYGANADDVMVLVAQHCPHLQDLFIPHSAGDRGVMAIAKGCPNLLNLDLSECPITDEGLISVVQHCSRLRSLALKNCRGITEVGVRVLREYHPPGAFLAYSLGLSSELLAVYKG